MEKEEEASIGYRRRWGFERGQYTKAQRRGGPENS